MGSQRASSEPPPLEAEAEAATAFDFLSFFTKVARAHRFTEVEALLAAQLKAASSKRHESETVCERQGLALLHKARTFLQAEREAVAEAQDAVEDALSIQIRALSLAARELTDRLTLARKYRKKP